MGTGGKGPVSDNPMRKGSQTFWAYAPTASGMGETEGETFSDGEKGPKGEEGKVTQTGSMWESLKEE